jgi:hypothetical protein
MHTVSWTASLMLFHLLVISDHRTYIYTHMLLRDQRCYNLQYHSLYHEYDNNILLCHTTYSTVV